MLSIGAMKSGQANYYQNLAQEDYYLHGGEPPGKWLGEGALALGLAGIVAGDDLAAHFLGFSKQGSKLVQNAGKPNRQPGWDLTLSAPKSVSVLWSQLTGESQQAIQQAHAAAVASTIDYIEKCFAKSRVGKAGADQVKVGLVVAAFEHSSSRAFDPQLHTHCLVMNLGVDATGVARSILSKPIYQAKMLAGAFYRCELSRALQERLGVDIERPLTRDGKPLTWFEVKGVSKSLLSHFSKRRAAIEAELGSRGMESASAAAFAALSTREAKTIVPPRSELHARWKREGVELGFVPEALLAKPRAVDTAEQHKLYRQALAEAVAELTFSENFFSQDELTRRTLEASQGLGLSAAAVVEAVAQDLQEEPLFVSLGTRNDKRLWTTQDVLAVEREFLESVAVLRERRFTPVAEKHVAASVEVERGHGANAFQLDAEQQAAVRYITQGKESVKVISGFAGTGKTDMLAAAKEALEKGGYRVLGTALAGVAARTLEEKTGIPSNTLRMRELQLYPDFKHTLKHHTKQLVRAALGQHTYKLPRLQIDAKTVLVIDEAGMVGTRDFALLAKAVVEQGGSLLAVGDEKQLASIERGGCLEMLVKTIGGVRLTEIRRQADADDRQAVKDVVAANPEEALRHYAEKGQFYVGCQRADAEAELIADWVKNGGAAHPQEHRIFAGTRAEVDRFNKLAQWERVKAGLVDSTERVEHEGNIFMVGDRVRFNAAARTLGIRKGEEGTVIACKDGFSGKFVAVALGEDTSSFSKRTAKAMKHHAAQLMKAALGRRTEKLPPRRDIVLVPLEKLNPLAKSYRGLSLNYAMTTHLGQGQTVKNSYVLLGGKMTDRELSYVQTSRHREQLFLYADQNEAGRTLTELARKTRPLDETAHTISDDVPNYSSLAIEMKLSRAKQLAADIEHELRHPTQENQLVL